MSAQLDIWIDADCRHPVLDAEMERKDNPGRGDLRVLTCCACGRAVRVWDAAGVDREIVAEWSRPPEVTR